MLVSEIKVLSAADIAAVVDREEKVFEVPEWGGAVKLKALSLLQRNQLMAECTKPGSAEMDAQKLVRKLCIYGVTEPVLTEELLNERAFAVVDRIAQAVLSLSGMHKEASLTATRTF
jgi:hypothetical protein